MNHKNQITKISDLVTDDCKQLFGDGLASVILYGSAATDEYNPKRSDLNFLIVLTEEGMGQLNLVHGPAARWRRKKVTTPLFLTTAYIESSLDTFPIEFLNIKQNYSVVHGEDVLEGLSFDKEFVRMQCEKELKGKLLLLRERYVETGGKTKQLIGLIHDSLSTFVFIFKGMLYLLDKTTPMSRQDTISAIAEDFKMDKDLLLSLLQIRQGTLKPGAKELDALFQRYLNEIKSLAMNIDQWKV